MVSCVRLQYRVGWPCCLVLTEELLDGFSKLGSLMMAVTAATHAMDQLFSANKLHGNAFYIFLYIKKKLCTG